MLHGHVPTDEPTSTTCQLPTLAFHALVLRLHRISPRPGIAAAFLNPSKDASPRGAAVARGRLTLLPLAFPTVMEAKEVLRDPTAAMTTSFVARTCPPPTPIPRNQSPSDASAVRGSGGRPLATTSKPGRTRPAEDGEDAREFPTERTAHPLRRKGERVEIERGCGTSSVEVRTVSVGDSSAGSRSSLRVGTPSGSCRDGPERWVLFERSQRSFSTRPFGEGVPGRTPDEKRCEPAS